MIRIAPRIEECVKTSRENPPTVVLESIVDDKMEKLNELDERLKVVEKLYVTDTELRDVVEDVEASFNAVLNATPRMQIDMSVIEKKIDESINKRLEIIDTKTIKRIVPKLNIAKKKP